MAQSSSNCAMIPETAAESLSDGKALLEDNGEQHGNGTSSIGNFTSQNSKPISNNNEAEIQNENTTDHDMAEKERPKLQDEESELREQQHEESLLEESFDSLPPPPPTTPKPPRQAQQDEGDGDHDGESELESLPPYDEYSPAKSPGNSSVVRTLSFESSSVVSNGSSIGSASASGGVPGRLGRVGRAGRMGIMFGLAGKAPRHHDRGESSDGSAVNGVGGGSSAGSTHGTGNASGNGTGILTRFLGMKKTLTGSFAGHSPDDGIGGDSASGGVGVVRSDNATIATAPKVGAENGQLERVEDSCDDDAGGDDESTHIHDNLNHDMRKEEQELQQQCHHANQVDSTPATVASFSTDSQTSDENHTSIAGIQTPIFSPFPARDGEGKGEEHEKAANIPSDIEKNGDTDDNDDEDGNVITNKGKSLGKSPTPSVNDEVSATPTSHALSEFASVATAPANASASSIASTSGLGEEVTVFPTSSNDNEKSNPPSPPTEPALPPSQNKVLSENQSEIGNTVNNRTDSSIPTAMESKQSTEYESSKDDGSSHQLMDSSNHVEGSSSHHNDGLLSRLFRKPSTRKPSLSMEEAGSDANAKVDADESSVVNGATAKNYSTAVLATTENFTSESLNKIENGDDSSAVLKQSSSNGGVDSSIEDGDLLVSFYGVVKPSLSTSDSDEASETNSWDDLLVDFADSSKGAKGSKPLGGEEMEKKGESTEAESNRAESKNNESSTSPEEVQPTPSEESTAEKMDATVSETSKLPSTGVIAGTAADEDENMLVSFYSKDEVQDLLVSFYGVVKPSSSLGEVVQKQNSSKSQQNDGGRSTNSSGDDVSKILAGERNILPLSADSLENDTTTSFKSNSSDVSNADEPEDASISTDNFLPEIMSAADSNSRLGSPTFSIDTADMESSPSKPNNDQVNQQNSAPFDRMPSDMKVILKDEITGVTVKEFFEIAWSEGASSDQDDHVVPPLYGPWLSSCGKRNVFIQQWEEIEADNERIDSFTHRRRVAFDFEKSTLGIHSKVKVHHEQNYRLTDDQLVLHMTISMKGFPYAECFRVEVRHLVTKRRSQEIAAVDVEIGLKVVFVKSTIIEKKIRNNTSEETIKSQSDLLRTIKKACSEEVTRKSLGEKSPDSSSGDAPMGNFAEGMTALETTDMTSIQNELQPVDEEFVVGDACEVKTAGITMDATVEPNLENSNVGRDVEIKQQTAGDESISNAEYFSVETGTDCSGFGAVYANGNETADKQQSLNFKDFPVDLIVEPSDIKQPIDKAGEVANQDEDNTASITNKPENTTSQVTLEGRIIKRGCEEASNNVEETRMYQVGSNPADSGDNERAEYVSVFVARDSELKKCNADDVQIKVHRNDSTEAAKECDVMKCSKENDLSSLLVIETPSASNESVPILIAAPQDQSFNSSDSSNIPTNMYKKKVVALNHNGDKQSVPLSRIAGQDSSLPATNVSIDKLMESNGHCSCFWCPDVLFALFRGSKPKAAFVSSAPKPDFDINNLKGSVDDFREELLALMDQGGITPTKRDRILQEVLVIQQSLDRISSISMNNIDQNAIV